MRIGLTLVVDLAAVAAMAVLAGCGAGEVAPDSEVHHVAPADASRPSVPPGPTLVRLERFDGRFGRHDTLTIARSGAASLQLAHGGGGFRKASCTLDARSIQGLRHDLRRLPIDGRARRVRGYRSTAKADGIIVARPPFYAVTYRSHLQVFGGATMPSDGAPLAARLERILTAHEGRCRTIFQRP